MCLNENCNQTVNNANNTIFISITTLIPLQYPEEHLSDLLNLFFKTKKILLYQHKFTKKRTAQKHDRQHIFDKTAYVQSQDLTPAQKVYTSSAHYIFHVCKDGSGNFGQLAVLKSGSM